MLPKTGIYYLPDFKVTGILKLLEDLIKTGEQDMNYVLINSCNMKYKIIANIELKR